MTFKTSLDRLAKGVTIVITLIFAGIIFIALYSAINDDEKAIPGYIIIGLLLVYFSVFSFRPGYYKLTIDKLIIQRPLINVTINLIEIKSIEQIEGKLDQAFRTFGVGGLFGYFGKFANKKLGSMTWYATRRDRAVLLTKVDNKKIVLTPDNPEEFVAHFNL